MAETGQKVKSWSAYALQTTLFRQALREKPRADASTSPYEWQERTHDFTNEILYQECHAHCRRFCGQLAPELLWMRALANQSNCIILPYSIYQAPIGLYHHCSPKTV